jgi:hypothetical protein
MDYGYEDGRFIFSHFVTILNTVNFVQLCRYVLGVVKSLETAVLYYHNIR